MKKLKLSLIVLNYISSSFSQIFSRPLKVKAVIAARILVFVLRKSIGSAKSARTISVLSAMLKQAR